MFWVQGLARTYAGYIHAVQQLCRSRQVSLTYNVVAFEHTPRLVACHLRGHPLWDTRPNQVANRCAAEVDCFSQRLPYRLNSRQKSPCLRLAQVSAGSASVQNDQPEVGPSGLICFLAGPMVTVR